MRRGKRLVLLLQLICCLLMLGSIDALAALRFDTVVSDAGLTGNNINYSNTSRAVAVDREGTIYVVYRGANGIRVTKSVDDGATFLPSVRIADDNGVARAEVAVSSSGKVYVAWVNNNQLLVSRSTDGATTFSAPLLAGAAYTSVHMATYGDYLYLVDPGGYDFYRSSDGGLTFSPIAVDSGRVFADVAVDPGSGDVVVQTDDPTVRYMVSHDNGSTFAPVVISGGYVYFSTAALSAGNKGRFLFVAGADGDTPRINVDDGSSTQLQSMPNNASSSYSRSLTADRFGNVVTGLASGSNISFSFSNDLGDSFSLVTEPAGTFSSVAINPANGDIVCVYENGGVINASIHKDLLIGYTSTSLTTSSSTSKFGEPLTLTATVSTVSGTPTGTVTFKSSGTVVGSAPVTPAGTAALVVSSLPVATSDITAEYSGAPDFGASASLPVSHTVEKAASALTLGHSAAPSFYGDVVSLTATAAAVAPGAGTVTGTVQFMVDDAALGAPVTLVNGSASLTTADLQGGSHTIYAVYSGDSNFLGSSAASYAQKVNPRATATTIATSVNPAPLGQPVTFTATVATTGYTPTGSVQFNVDGKAYATPVALSRGIATLTTSALPAGNHIITGTYLGNANFAQSSSTGLAQSVKPLCSAPSHLSLAGNSTFTLITWGASSTRGVNYVLQYSNDGGRSWITAYTGPSTMYVLLGRRYDVRVYATKSGYLDSNAVYPTK